jgi:ribonuclease-3
MPAPKDYDTDLPETDASVLNQDSPNLTFDEAYQTHLIELLTDLGIEPPWHLPLYAQALTHSSYTYEYQSPRILNYERLEFLGDAVLKLMISDYLYERFPHYREGELTKIRAVVVSDAVLATLARTLNLGHYMIFGPNEARSGGAKKSSNLACAFEALLGALYLDGKLENARRLLYEVMQDPVTKVDLSKTKDNYKAVLQELTQAEGMGLPSYTTVKETGPSHRKKFVIEVTVADEVLGIGEGKTKKEAQQAAAKTALLALNQLL